jgi:hypothetical protein
MAHSLKNGGVIGVNFGMGFINPKDAEKLTSATNTEAEAPTLTGEALDEYGRRMHKHCSGNEPP